MVGLAARYGYIGPQENTAEWPVTAWIDSPLELLDWVGVPRPARPRCAGAGAGAGADS